MKSASTIMSPLSQLRLPVSLFLLFTQLLFVLTNASPTSLSKRDVINLRQNTVVYLDEPFTLEWTPLGKFVDVLLYRPGVSGSIELVYNEKNAGRFTWVPKNLPPKAGYVLGVRSYDDINQEEKPEGVVEFTIAKARTDTTSGNNGEEQGGGSNGEGGGGNGGEVGGVQEGKKSPGTTVGAAVGGAVGGILVLIGAILFFGHRKRGWFSSSSGPTSTSSTSHPPADFAEADGSGIEYIKPPPKTKPDNLGRRMSKRFFGRHELMAKSVGKEKPGHGRHELDVEDCETAIPQAIGERSCGMDIQQSGGGGGGDGELLIETGNGNAKGPLVHELPVNPSELADSHVKD